MIIHLLAEAWAVADLREDKAIGWVQSDMALDGINSFGSPPLH